jgi:putative effector of murein hydrolase
MYERRALMRSSARSVGASVSSAAVIGLFGTALAARALELPQYLRLASVSRQVTAPLAIAIAGMVGANPSLAATIVVLTGLLVANFGAAALDALGVTSPVARGLAMGGAGHGLGTAALATSEKEAFPFAAIAMALNATLSTILVTLPPVRKILLAAAGLAA